MYRKLKNILGVSLMVLAIVISQIPMPDALAETEPETAIQETETKTDNNSHTVTFSMNGGSYNGSYNEFTYKDKMPVLIIDDGKTIDVFPDEESASYSGYKTEQDTWYTDRECLTKFDKASIVSDDITIYKKWYNITSDGTSSADKGFHISADKTVLYQYDGDEKNVVIPQTVTTIASGAFVSFDNVRGITLPANIKNIEQGAFSGVKDDNTIVYIYDSDTADSREYGKKLADEYEQFVYSGYLDAENTEKIVGIDYQSDTSKEEGAEVKEGSGTEESKSGESETGESKSEESKQEESKSGESETGESKSEESKTEDDKQEESKTEESKSEESKPEESKVEESSSEESSTVIIIEPDTKYTITFDTGISGVEGEKREVLKGRTVSELVSVDGDQPKILKKDSYSIQQDDGKQELTYTFKGWYKDKGFAEEWDFANDTIEGETTIYAKWDKQARAYYFVTYNTTEGNESAANIPEKQKIYEDEKLEKPSQNPSLKNKVFKGWYTDAEDTSTEYKSWGKPVTKDLSLYAHFEEKSNTVIFHMNGGGFTGKYKGTSYTDAASLKAQVTAGKGISSSDYPENDSSAKFKYSNYETDSNWYKDKECLTAYTQKDAALKGDLTLYKKWYYTSSGFTMNTSSNVLYKYSGSVADVTIPNSVTVIGTDAFASAGSISSITLPDNISDVKENAFSGVNKVSKDITITGKTEKAKNMAKGLANQYTRLVYKDSSTDKKDESKNDSSPVTTAESGSIKLGATIAGSAGTASKTTTSSATASPAQPGSSIALGAGSIGTGASSGQTVVPAGGGSATQTTPTGQGAAVTQTAPAGQDRASAASKKGVQGSSASTAQGSKTTTKQNITSASAPRSTEHIKDSTPKTGDPLQYRMLLVCAMFSVGALLILTGNGKKKKASAS